MKKTVLPVLFLVQLLMFNIPEVCAFGHQTGFQLGTSSYKDDIGSIYNAQAFLVGFHYSLLFHRFWGLNIQYDYLSNSEGDIIVYGAGGVPLDRIKTEIEAGLFSVTPTFYFRFQPHQRFVPKLGVGFSFFHGRQSFDDTQYLSVSDNDFRGTGLNYSGGFNYYFSDQVGMQFESRYHAIRISIEYGSGDTDTEYNGIAEYYIGFIYTFGFIPNNVWFLL